VEAAGLFSALVALATGVIAYLARRLDAVEKQNTELRKEVSEMSDKHVAQARELAEHSRSENAQLRELVGKLFTKLSEKER
jgi:hypothetical protein